MQHELDAAAGPGMLPIALLGVNEVGQESDNEVMCDGRTLPWLQDTSQQDVWHTKWVVTWRDVVVLDAENRRIAVYNLTTHNLGDPINYATLRDLLLRAAGGRTRPALKQAQPH